MRTSFTVCRLGAIISFLFVASGSIATTVIPPAFDDLVGRADYIVRSVVKSVTCELRSAGANRHIITKVELDVKEVIAGQPPSPLVLEMIGGTVGTERMVVHGAPEFKVGDEDILFVHGNGVQFNPLVALAHGRYPIKRDRQTGQGYMTRSNGEPLVNEQEVVLPLMSAPVRSERAVAASPLTPAAFIGKIKTSRQVQVRSSLEN